MPSSHGADGKLVPGVRILKARQNRPGATDARASPISRQIVAIDPLAAAHLRQHGNLFRPTLDGDGSGSIEGEQTARVSSSTGTSSSVTAQHSWFRCGLSLNVKHFQQILGLRIVTPVLLWQILSSTHLSRSQSAISAPLRDCRIRPHSTGKECASTGNTPSLYRWRLKMSSLSRLGEVDALQAADEEQRHSQRDQ